MAGSNKRVLFINATALVLALGLPIVVHAQTFNNLVETIFDLINFAIGILVGVAIASFFWGLIKYLFSAKGGQDQKKASNIMVWGILGLFAMLSVYGIIRLLQGSFGLNTASNLPAPNYGNTALPSCSRSTDNLACFAKWIASVFGIGTALLVGGAIALYFWGIAYNLFGSYAGGKSNVTSLRSNIIWGLLALFVMFSIWGIVRLLGSALFGGNNFNSML
jgi:hypothetical protein